MSVLAPGSRRCYCCRSRRSAFPWLTLVLVLGVDAWLVWGLVATW